MYEFVAYDAVVMQQDGFHCQFLSLFVEVGRFCRGSETHDPSLAKIADFLFSRYF